MTGFMHEKEFSRKTLLKGGGALIVGFSALGSVLTGKASADGVDPFASNGGVNQYPIDSWIVINPDNTATILTGGIRQGTGSDTGLLMIAGEELDMDLSQLEFVMADTNVTPNTGQHSASNTIRNSGAGLRAAAAYGKQVLLGLASTQLGTPTSQLSVSKGVVSGGGKTVSYGQLLGGKLFNVSVPPTVAMNPTGGPDGGYEGNKPGIPGTGILPGQAPAKPVSQYTLVGTSPPRIDIPAIVTGTATYIHNVRVPGMLHGRVVRPRGQMAYGFGAPIVSVDESSIKDIPNVQIVRKNNFLGVVAPLEYNAIQAAAQLKVQWAEPPAVLPGGGDEFEAMRALDSAGESITVPNPGPDGKAYVELDRGDVVPALASAAHVVSGTYGFGTRSHNPIGPMCAVADVTPQGARIFNGTQGPYQDRPVIAAALGMPENRVRVTACMMGACFGSGAQYTDNAVAAALMSQVVGAPVRVQLMRWDEIGWDRYGPAQLMDYRAGIDSKGNLVAIDFVNTMPQWGGVTWNTMLTGAPAAAPNIWVAFAPGSMYNSPNQRYTVKSLQITGNWVSGSALRTVGGHAITFAIEQIIDELAYAAKMDPVAFRIQNVVQGNDWTLGERQDQLLAALNAVAKSANWQPKVAASNLSDANIVTGRGVAWEDIHHPINNGLTATIADVEVNKKTGKVTVKHIYQAASTGLAVYPGGIENQVLGGSVQATSWVLTEQLRFSKTNVTSSDFVSYPILRFKDSPKVTVTVLQAANQNQVPSVLTPTPSSATPYAAGIGEDGNNGPPAAIANAFFDATGVRMRTPPFTPSRVRAALKAAGVA